MNLTCPLCAARALTCDGDCLATLHKSGGPKECANCQNEPAQSKATGPRSAQGKAVAARNATTHGLFARDIVLPSLGEDPEGYRQITDELTSQLQPRGLLERHYVEKIAAASWRLRRLHRWQAQIFEDEALTEDERLDRLDKVLRHETALHRQIDTAVKMLNKDVPQLSKGRARDRALLDTMQTELDCRENRENWLEVEFEARERLKEMEKTTAALSDAGLDAAQNCQNEPAPPTLLLPDAPRIGGGGATSSGSPLPLVGRGVGVSSMPGVGASSQHYPPQRGKMRSR